MHRVWLGPHSNQTIGKLLTVMWRAVSCWTLAWMVEVSMVSLAVVEAGFQLTEAPPCLDQEVYRPI